MDGAIFANIHRGSHAAIGNKGQGLLLRLIKKRNGNVFRMFGLPWGDLDEIERCIRILEQRAHHLNIGRLQSDILFRPHSVFFALIPEHALECKGDQRRNLTVKQSAGQFLSLFREGFVIQERKVELIAKIFFYGFPVHPCLNGRSAPGGYQDTHGNIKDRLQPHCKKIRHSACIRNGLWGILFPCVLSSIQRLFCSPFLYCTHPDGRGCFCRHNYINCSLYRLTAKALHWHLHI